jgi:hypothetical protein
MGISTQNFITHAGLMPGDAKIKSWHDDWGMTVWGSGGKTDIFFTWELNSPVKGVCPVLANHLE